ncbi:MAG: hypothetical protein O3A00_28305, partial [Planctomycetota bacterium]|nr:hypothetical protein [Planctomycetota bacterium]
GRWNIGTSDGDHLSLNLSSIPDSVRSLRLRRMDNGATVVIAMTKAWLTDEHTDTAAKIGWMAKNSDFWKSKRLGVFRTDEEIRDAPQGSVFVSSGSFSRGYAGWGFGHTDNRWNSPQGFTWNGQSLGPTVFEIAVSDAPLESITPFSLRVNSPTTATATPTELPSDNPVVAQLETAKSDHQAAVATARQKVLQSIDASLQELGAKGDADGIEKLAAARKEFEEHDAVRTVSNTLRSKLVSFQSEINRADQNLLKAYTRAVAAFKREQNEDLVTLLSNQIEEGVGYEAERWIVLFSSPNPSLWNTRSRGPFKFARPATDAPIDLKYLRMRVISAKSGDKTPPVICKMTKDRLVRQSDMDGVGWNGLKVQDHNAVHLGMYLVDKAVKFPAPRNTQGLVSVWDQGFTGHLGWGFGHHIRVDKVQGYSWGGLTSPQPLQVEIAVSSKPLRDHEWKVLQGGTTP